MMNRPKCMFLSACIAVISSLLILPRTHCQTPTTLPPERIAQSASKINEVDFAGVSFSYDSSLASRIVSQMMPAVFAGMPADIIPEHPSFTFVGYPRLHDPTLGDATIKVFSIAKFREAVSIASKEDAKHVVYPPNPPDWTNSFDEEVRVLKALLAAKPTDATVGRFIARARGQEGCSAAMPFLPMWEACMAFVAHVRYVNFKNGAGVFFLTQWDKETEQISNQSLEYAFQGMTADGRYWLYAEFAVAAPFLPQGDEPGVIKWNETNYLLSHRSKEYQAYVRPVLAKLEALPDDQFQPNLKLLEQLIMTTQVHSN